MAYLYALNPFTKKMDIIGNSTPVDSTPGGALNVLLLEDGFALLLEDGTYLLLEA